MGDPCLPFGAGFPPGGHKEDSFQDVILHIVAFISSFELLVHVEAKLLFC